MSRYDVVAMSLPIVYTVDGDHDPNGLLFTLERHRPMLQWLRREWQRGNEYLPRLHRRRQLMQIVVDGLWRYEEMRARLQTDDGEFDDLLDDLGGPEGERHRDHGVDANQAGIDDRHGICGRGGRNPRLRAIRQNYRATLDGVTGALAELTGGRIDALDPDPAVRARWRAEWQAQLVQADRAMEAALQRVDASLAAARTQWPAAFDWQRWLCNDHTPPNRGLGVAAPPYDRCNPLRPVPLVHPLVLRAYRNEELRVRLRNDIRDRLVGLHVQGGGLEGGVRSTDGANVGRNPSTLVRFGRTRAYTWRCPEEGAWPINDLADVRGSEAGSNVHGLFGALIVGANGTTYHDPETGDLLEGQDRAAVGLYVDIHVDGDPGQSADPGGEYVDLHQDGLRTHREFAVFLHDEPEIHSPLHPPGGEHSVMPLSYRAEPMPNRLPHRMRRYAGATPENPPPGQTGIDFSAVRIDVDDELAEVFSIARTTDGDFLERVSGEEQHHSSWLFGDPVTPILRCYAGDPARIRLIHAAVKETHVFHLHVHQWRATRSDTGTPGRPEGSQLLDSITIGPQTAYTIDPLYGSGSRQHAFGDVIWHCHLYPHFHHGMWGLWRSFDRLVDGSRAFPDGTPCRPLTALPGRPVDPPVDIRDGFPWFIDAGFPQKTPPPPALVDAHVVGRRRLLEMPLHSPEELRAMPQGVKDRPRSGAVFVDLDTDAVTWNRKAGLPPPRIISYDIEVAEQRVDYNDSGWFDPHGHHYRLLDIAVTQLDANGDPLGAPVREPVPPWAGPTPFFPRANHGDIVELRFHNALGTVPGDDFDFTAQPVECGLHVHLVKFDVLSADGSSTGWNYLSGASSREAVGPDQPGETSRIVGFHRWVVDEEFGPCFFHDHLLANYRQKRGLYAALIAEPHGANWLTVDQNATAWSAPEAVIVPPNPGPPAPGPGLPVPGQPVLPPYREACLGIADFVPLHDRNGRPLNPPEEIGGVSDPGVMGVNYRNAPLRHRGKDPSEWFSARRRDPDEVAEPAPDGAVRRFGDPETPIIHSYPGERLRIRLIQGSHEEQHGFTLHGMRWRREWHDHTSTLVNQQTLGISEAFTLDIDPQDAGGYGLGDHLWSFQAIDDLWLGCWGYVRVQVPTPAATARLPRLPLMTLPGPQPPPLVPPHLPTGPRTPVREYVVVARRREHEYTGRCLTDPWGLEYAVAEGVESTVHRSDDGRIVFPPLDPDGLPDQYTHLGGYLRGTNVRDGDGPLVLRAVAGEWIKVTVVNELLLPDPEHDHLHPGVRTAYEAHARASGFPPWQNPDLPRFGPEVSPPRVPVERLDQFRRPADRTVSPRVSLHPSLLSYDVVSDDGANVGHNHDGTIGTLDVSEMRDTAHPGHGGEATPVVGRPPHTGHGGPNWRTYWWYADPKLAANGVGQVCSLQDMGDIRNHRHHGLIGAIVVLPEGHRPADGAWTGPTARIVDQNGNTVAEERVLFLQDGLRLFANGDPDAPLPDITSEVDPVDAGQRGISYRAEPIHVRTQLNTVPATPLLTVPGGSALWLRVVTAADKPRNHVFTVHGHSWPGAPRPGPGPHLGAVGGLTAGSASDLVLQVADDAGDYAYRSGAFRWAVQQGMWGIVRVT